MYHYSFPVSSLVVTIAVNHLVIHALPILKLVLLIQVPSRLVPVVNIQYLNYWMVKTENHAQILSLRVNSLATR